MYISFNEEISTFIQKFTGISITSHCIQFLNRFIIYYIREVVQNSTTFVYPQLNTFGEIHLRHGIQSVHAGELANTMLDWMNQHEEKESFQTHFNEEKIRYVINQILPQDLFLEPNIPPCIAYMLEYILYELIDLAIVYCKCNEQDSKINTDHFIKAVQRDAELAETFRRLKILPFLPNIEETIIPRFTFCEYVKNLDKVVNKEDKKFSKSALNFLQCFVEDKVIHYLQDAKDLCLFNNRVRVSGSDLEKIYELKHKENREF